MSALSSIDFSGFQRQGFQRLEACISQSQLNVLRQVAQAFHVNWERDNLDFYQSRAVNSAYLTAPDYLDNTQRELLFQFIGSQLIKDVISPLFADCCGFLNTQLFFNPVNPDQRNYWHRDCQYHLSLAQQQAALTGPLGLHLRLALYDEPGLEFIPGSHKRWDTEMQLDVRLSQAGHTPSDELPGGMLVPLQAGDMLLFDANMIHRGLYGMDRLALDILFCDPVPELLQFAREDCLPDTRTLESLVWPDAFTVTANMLKNCGNN
ncbi:phytanoyl-CoA dioxygenase family protein [Shewanella submarina]|uniref:Phytanoyl-CoA dioxygenase family protein n=1 Tax=Shewanella submarina TaxID=2016376 RepID=A0ABV7GFT0_9GAMM|nr:phytanoyl-CoA dioxygenase family protein [Shewanella submarina]MCL1038670.1 phytanoyl-CoA dioxygenase family protein [Shewanella submarina]